MDRTETRVHVIATQHLDVAWRWTRAPYGEELMRQCFERAIEMIEANPEARFVFSRSTVWSFQIVEQHYPALFEKIKTYVISGQIELCGGEWVEPDHLIPSGESLIRQCALGQWYFLNKFGRTASVCWDPDIFGHPHSMPQIMLKCGLEGFYSHRSRPNDDEGHALYQFVWEGPDGSQVFYLAGSWIAAPDAPTIRAAMEEQAHQALPAIHVVTGRGSDRRITMKRDWVTLPSTAGDAIEDAACQWSTASDALADMKTYAGKLPVVRGELGFQFTGTYTSNGFNKRTNRAVETLLIDAEKAAAWAATLGFRYPGAQLTQAWREHCVNQFHDVICGCSVPEVHAEDRELWADAIRRGRYARDEALAFLCDRIDAGLSPRPNKDDEIFAVFNLLAWPRAATFEIPLAADEEVNVTTEEGRSLPQQVAGTHETRRALVRLPDVPGIGYRLLRVHRSDGTPPQPVLPATEQPLVLENTLVRAVIDRTTGELTSLVAKEPGREFIKPGGSANRWIFLEDAHNAMPAWTIEYTGRELDPGRVETVEVLEHGPVRQTVRVVRTVPLSPEMPPTTIVQDIVLKAESPVLTFNTRGEWYASQVMAKAVFDLAFESTTIAAEAPYAVIERTPGATAHPRDSDTTAEGGVRPDKESEKHPDQYMQTWLDVSDGDRGILFLNDGRYGYDADGGRVRLSLLRAPYAPLTSKEPRDEPAERAITGLGPVAFSYGVVVHSGGWRDVDAPRFGHAFNHPLLVRPVQSGFIRSGVWRDWWEILEDAPTEVPSPFVEILETASTQITAVKRAEDGDGMILRLVETHGEPDFVRLRWHHPVRSATVTDMLERAIRTPTDEACVSSEGKDIKLKLTPWEIKTVRIKDEMKGEQAGKTE